MAKTNKSKLEVNRLVQVTNQLLNDKIIKISELENTKLLSNKSNVWFIICVSYFGNYVYKNALNIFSWWTRDSEKFKSKIRNAILQEKSNKTEIILLTDQLDIIKNYAKDYRIFKNDSKLRKKFSRPFDDFISEILQKKGFNCWLKCKYNWFSKSFNKKNNKNFWKGVYNCISKDCSNIFVCYIREPFVFEDKCVKIEIEYEENFKHKEKVHKTIRIIGDERIEESWKINSNGSLDYMNENIILNEMNEGD